MLYTSPADLLYDSRSTAIKASLTHIYLPGISCIKCRILALIIILLVFSGCSNSQENTLASREAAISAREAQLITLIAELVKERKQLELDKAELIKKTAESEQIASDKATNSKKTEISKIVLGGLENILLSPPGIEFSARIDTGAQTSSLNAMDLVEFERDGKPYVKFHILHPETDEKIELTRRIRSHVRVKEKDAETEAQRRPVIRLRVKLASIDEQTDFTLVDRSKFKQQVLIGRNFLRDLAIVDVSKEYMIPATDKTDKAETDKTDKADNNVK